MKGLTIWFCLIILTNYSNTWELSALQLSWTPDKNMFDHIKFLENEKGRQSKDIYWNNGITGRN